MKIFKVHVRLRCVPIVCFLSFILSDLTAQISLDSARWEITHQENLYLNDSLSAKEYLHTMDSIIANQQSKGILFDDAELIKLLGLYKKLANSHKNFAINRGSYFNFLMNNADLSGKGGEAIFYAEKYAQELERQGLDGQLNSVYIQCVFYIQNRNYNKAIEVFDRYLPAINHIVTGSTAETFNGEKAGKAIQIIAAVNNALLSVGELSKVKANTELAFKIFGVIEKFAGPEDEMRKLVAKCILRFIEIEIAIHEKNYSQAGILLQDVDRFIDENHLPLRHMLPYMTMNLLNWKMTLFSATENKDSLEYYIRKMEEEPNLYVTSAFSLNRFKTHLHAVRGEYKQAYTRLDSSLNLLYNEFGVLSNEVTELQYAHAESEYARAELKEAERTKNRRLLMTALTGFIALAIGVIAYFMVKNEKAKTSKKLKAIDDMVSIQINEAVNHSTRIAQENLGQDLHDDFSSTLASILKNAQVLEAIVKDDSLRKEMVKLRNQTNLIYESVRDKSHTLYKDSKDTSKDNYDESIKKIINSALPNARFAKTIEIDMEAMVLLNLNQRIEILRIIQEAVTNILKHARGADEISLFIYRIDDSISIQISDNGKEFKENTNGDNLGLKSIRKRAEMMNGTFTIEHDEGTVLSINFPMEIND